MDKLRLALGIISGRITGLNWEHYETLGYNTYKFSAFGSPSWSDVKEKAEDIIWCAISGMGTNHE